MTPFLLRTWGGCVRLAARWPSIATLAPFILLVGAWWSVTALEVFPRAFLPGPMEVVRSFGSLVYTGVLPEYLQDSMVRLAVGSFWGIVLGVPLGILVGLSQRAHAALWPLLLFFQAIGDIAWLPILVIWFGYGLVTITVVIVYTVIFPVILNTVLGVRSIPVNMHRAALSLGASRTRLLWEVVLPGALPNIMTGLRNGLGYGWRALIATEIIVGTSGIGFLMFDARRAGSVVEILLGMIVLGILWYIVDGWILAPIERATGQRWGLVTR
jgi:NitT/TauT family transport system permease protein/taurine transport system permease protein